VVQVQAVWLGLMIVMLAAAVGAQPITVERTDGGLRLEASLAQRVFAPGEVVQVTVVARNLSAAPLGVVFNSGQRLDLIVRRPRGDEVWRWSHDKAFTQAIQTMLLRPQESSVLRVAWDQRDLQGRRVDPGVYEAIVLFMGRTEGVGRGAATLAPLTFTIGAR
jgi:Intracellular proteinase inhibitor